MEEANIFGGNHLDTDVRLPPRKRLLAGLKKQSSDCTSSPSLLSSNSTDFSTRVCNLVSSDSKSLGLSPEEIVDASRSAALAAAKVSVTAKVAAEEKAAVAAKAAAAAKRALELVASVSGKTTCKQICLIKNKQKKHVPVKLLYKKHQPVENCETDEQLAHRLHRAMNSSPRISKNSVSSDWKIHNNNNHIKQPTLEDTRFPDGIMFSQGNPPSIGDRNAGAGEVDCGGFILEVQNIDKVGKKTLECSKTDWLEMGRFLSDGEAEASHLKKKYWHALEVTGSTGRKRGGIKQKKLSLSLCAIRDRENFKEDPEPRGCSLMGEPEYKSASRNVPLFDVNTHTEGEVSVEAMSIWKSKEFKGAPCFAENKIMQSLCSNPTVITVSAMIEVDQ